MIEPAIEVVERRAALRVPSAVAQLFGTVNVSQRDANECRRGGYAFAAIIVVVSHRLTKRRYVGYVSGDPRPKPTRRIGLGKDAESAASSRAP